MDTEIANVAGPFAALLLLFVCVVLFSMSRHHVWLKRKLRILLFVLGVIPGIAGTTWGLWQYIQLREPQLSTVAFALLVIGVSFLVSAAKNEERT